MYQRIHADCQEKILNYETRVQKLKQIRDLQTEIKAGMIAGREDEKLIAKHADLMKKAEEEASKLRFIQQEEKLDAIVDYEDKEDERKINREVDQALVEVAAAAPLSSPLMDEIMNELLEEGGRGEGGEEERKVNAAVVVDFD